jgi:hypothetical protein
MTEKNQDSQDGKPYSKGSNVLGEASKKERVWKLLDKHPSLKAKQLCYVLQLPYKENANHVTKLRSEWKHYSEIGEGLKRLSFHNQHWKGFALRQLDRRQGNVTDLAVRSGWLLTRARNRMLVWRDVSLGRIEWFETGTILIGVSKPASKMKLYQLLSKAFLMTSLSDLIGDIKVYQAWQDSFYQHDGHLVYDTGQRLPYARIELLKGSNGIVVTLGDKSHPQSVEIQYCFPEYAEKSEVTLELANKALEINGRQLEQFSGFLKDLSQPKPPDREVKYVS